MTPTVYHLSGPPASGKRTVGLALAAQTGAVLLDNHLFNDAVFKPYGADGLRPVPAEIRALTTDVWAPGLRAAALAPADISQIFTAYHTGLEGGAVSAGKIRAVAAARGAHYVPVWLDCDPAERERRVTHPGRLARAKLRDPALLRAILEASGTLPPPPDALVLDTTRMSPDDAARQIVAFRAGLT